MPRRLLGVCVFAGAIVSPEAWAQDDSSAVVPPSRMSATLETNAKGDGRTAVSVTPRDGPEVHPDELASHPMVAAIDCPKATVIAAAGQLSPSVIPVAKPKAQELSCVLRFRGATAPFKIKVVAPGPGLYGELSKPQPRAGVRSLVIRPFVIGNNKKSKRPKNLRAGASAGSITVSSDLSLNYSLPKSAAPRALAVVFTDGQRGSAVFMPFIGKTELPVKARKNTQVQVRISGSWFGPVEVKKRRITLDIEVPPGVNDAVVQAIGKRGNVTETFADLKTPQLSRIVAIASTDKAEAGKAITIYVAVASPRGAAADSGTQLIAEAKGGTISAAVSQGPGLWKLEYTAPTQAGSTEIRISVASDSEAGEAIVPLQVEPASASKFEFEFAAQEYQPGASVEGTLRVSDAFGNALPADAVQLSFAGQPLVGTPSEAGILIEAKVPNTLPAERKMELVATVGGVKSSHTVATVAGPSVSAKIRASIDERQARLRIVASDSFGNSVSTKGLTIVADAASASALVDEGEFVSTLLTANTGVRSTLVRVMSEGKELTNKKITFDPPPSAILFGVYANGGWSSNGGELTVPRAGLGIGTRRSFGPVEASLLVGVEAFAAEDKVVAVVAGMDQKLIRQLRGFAIPIMLRGRIRISRDFGAALALGVTPTATSAKLGLDSSAGAFNTWTNGVRGELSGDYRLGRGRVILGTSYGRTELAEGPIVGDIDGLRIYAGYEVWPLDFGP